ncbi:MAG: right-handed parallel beta-helix repeat-containing protein [Armatimonadota bacterium]
MTDNILLPDGTPFPFWKPEPAVRTFHVAQTDHAFDENPGTAASPWRTISHAAKVLEPGDRVLVHAGVYREWVKPRRGGTGPERMITYAAAPGEKVVITACDRWQPAWRVTDTYFVPMPKVHPPQPDPHAPRTWRAALDPLPFEGANPFNLPNFPPQGGTEWKQLPSMHLRRGQLFLDGRPLTQVGSYGQLAATEDAFWVEDNGMALHLRLAGDRSPEGLVFDITTREQVFAPVTRFLNYIRLQGFRFFGAGNGVPIPPPQRGAVSANAGHHWVIEDCEIAHANSIGVDLGCGFWDMHPGERLGGHIVRRCHIHHCGVAGVCGWFLKANQDILIEDNLIDHIGWMPITDHFETAGIKIHYCAGSLIRRNVFRRNRHCAALWLDCLVINTRITQNIFADTRDNPFGAVFIEISQGPTLIDNNLIIGCSQHGFYEHDAARCLVAQNLIWDGGGTAIFFKEGDPNRKEVFGHPEDDNRAFGNILGGFHAYILASNTTHRSNANVLAGLDPAATVHPFGVSADFSGQHLEEWHALGHDRQSVDLPLDMMFDPDTLTLRVTGAALPTFDFPVLLEAVPPLNELIGTYPPPVDWHFQARVAPAEVLLAADLMGHPRAQFSAGPLNELLLDGTPVRVDPRHL